MDARCAQPARFGVDMAIDHVAGENMGAVWVWISEEVGEGDGGEGVVVREVGVVEFYHCGGGKELFSSTLRSELDGLVICIPRMSCRGDVRGWLWLGGGGGEAFIG